MQLVILIFDYVTQLNRFMIFTVQANTVVDRVYYMVRLSDL